MQRGQALQRGRGPGRGQVFQVHLLSTSGRTPFNDGLTTAKATFPGEIAQLNAKERASIQVSKNESLNRARKFKHGQIRTACHGPLLKMPSNFHPSILERQNILQVISNSPDALLELQLCLSAPDQHAFTVQQILPLIPPSLHSTVETGCLFHEFVAWCSNGKVACPGVI